MTDITLQNCLNASKVLVTAINTYITCPLKTCAVSAATSLHTAFLVHLASVGYLELALVKIPVETKFEKTIRLLAKIEIQEAQCLAYLEGEFGFRGKNSLRLLRLGQEVQSLIDVLEDEGVEEKGR